MLRFPNAKINLGLHITQKREDGFHDLETIFYPVKTMRDALEFVPASDVGTRRGAFYPSGLPVGGEEQTNLVYRAYKLMQERFPEKVPQLDIYLHKAIPMGAGLGGGSADAAFALQMINDMCSLGLVGEDLEAMALELGSDCPFFIRNTPQYAMGRGERMEPVAIDLSGYRIEVVCPEVHVSTRAAFSRVMPKPSTFDLRTLPQVPVAEWKDVLKNDFEESVFVQFPEIAAVKEKLYADGAVYAAMSGSGSAVYGLFKPA
jgi:4-diphosphocytidyl-2-C-methyl-D-erythritol kinase